MRRRVRLTESDLHRIVKESVNRILKEEVNPIPTYSDGRPMSFADITAVASISAMNPQHYDSLSQELKDIFIDDIKFNLILVKHIWNI